MGSGDQWSSSDGGHLVSVGEIEERRQRVTCALSPDTMRWGHKQASNRTTENRLWPHIWLKQWTTSSPSSE